MLMARERYPNNCPWDFGPGQHQADQDEWILVNGDQFVKFSKNQHDQNWFNINRNDEIYEQFLSYQARLTYQRLLDKGFRLEGKK